MTILFVCSARTWGGNERWTALAMERLRISNRVLLACRGSLEKAFGEDVETKPLPFLSLLDPYTFLSLYRMIRKHRVDVVISTKRKEYVICGIICRVLGIPHVIRLGIVRRLPGFPWKRWAYEKGCDRVLVNARAIKEQLLDSGFRHGDRIRVIHNGVPEKAPAVAGGDGPFRIVSSGALIPRKGHMLLLKALSLLPADALRRTEAVILGDGSQKKALMQAAEEYGLSGIVEFPGFQERPDEWLKNADLFVLLSDNEGISNGLLEAMAHGLPVLTSEAGGAAEAVTHGEEGFLVERDPVEIAARIQQLQSSPKLAADMGRKGRRKALAGFSLEHMGEELERLLKDVVSDCNA